MALSSTFRLGQRRFGLPHPRVEKLIAEFIAAIAGNAPVREKERWSAPARE
jgi:hypothetical protein